MPVERLRQYLEEQHVKYVRITHPPAFTAQEIAASAHLSGNEVAKTVVVKLDGAFAMAVLPAPDKVSASRLREVSGATMVELASEQEFADLFPRCEVGAMPPFGNLWGMSVFVDDRLIEDEEIAFNAGSHTELIRLAWSDYARLVNPRIAHLSTRD
jgi:Ala-tRNA(Pro) deacylase